MILNTRIGFAPFFREQQAQEAAEMAAAGASQVTIAQKTWEMSNNIMEVRRNQDCVTVTDFLEGGRWRRDLQVRQTAAAKPPGGQAVGEGSSLLQGAFANFMLSVKATSSICRTSRFLHWLC